MPNKINRISALAVRFGILGLLGLMVGIMGASFSYRGYDGEAFNFLNHTISELGNYGHSTAAVVLNGGLFFGGLSLVLFCLFSLQLLRSLWAYPFILLLSLAYAALALTGLFPLNVYHLHILGLKWFFYFASLSSLAFVCYMAITPRPRYSTWVIIPALLAFVTLTAFLFIPHLELGSIASDRPLYQKMVLTLPRPVIWWPAVLEWLSISFVLIWSSILLFPKPIDASEP